jgi:hypothetical protein
VRRQERREKKKGGRGRQTIAIGKRLIYKCYWHLPLIGYYQLKMDVGRREEGGWRNESNVS